MYYHIELTGINETMYDAEAHHPYRPSYGVAGTWPWRMDRSGASGDVDAIWNAGTSKQYRMALCDREDHQFRWSCYLENHYDIVAAYGYDTE